MVDPITAEIVRHSFEAVADQVYETICRASSNPGVNEMKDCGAGIYSYDGSTTSMVSRAGIIAHSMAGVTSAQACLEFFRGDLAPGDVLLVSDSYHGGSHLGCWTVVVPMFFDGKPRFLAAGRLHLMDQGGPAPGAVNPDCREIWHEGFRPSPLKLYEKGQRRRELWDWLVANNRMPDMLESDIEAMVGACRVGELRVREIVERHGLSTVDASLEWIYDYSEQQFRRQIAEWPDGEYTAAMLVDTDYADARDLKIEVTVRINGGDLEFDFTGTDDQTDGVVNSVPANTIAYICVVLSVLCPDIPVNSGFFRPFNVVLPKGSLVNPTPPAATALGTIVCGGQIGQAVMKACEQFVPERVGNISIDTANTYVIGLDTRPDRLGAHGAEPARFMFWDESMVAMDNSATFGVDGWGAWATPFSVARPTNHEFHEVLYPTTYLQAEYSTDSAAPGQWRGSPAYVMRRVDSGATDAVTNFNAQSLVHPHPGYVGGYEGVGNFYVVNEGDSDEAICGEFALSQPYRTEAVIFSQSGGGGGWGDPLERDATAVLSDVIDEYVSIEGAAKDYGVVIDPTTWTVDAAATTALREKLSKDSRSRRGIGREWTIDRAQIRHRTG